MVTETLSVNQLRRRAARLQPKAGDPSFMMLAAQSIGMPEDFLAEAAKAVRQLLVAEMERHPPRPDEWQDGRCPGQNVRLSSVGMLLAALGYVPEALSAEESLYGLKTVSDYERQRAALAEGF